MMEDSVSNDSINKSTPVLSSLTEGQQYVNSVKCEDNGSDSILLNEISGSQNNDDDLVSKGHSGKRSGSEASESNPGHDSPRKPKKRRALSCFSCRKLKTRCDFEIEHGKCHRCVKLRLECSLTKEYNLDPSKINGRLSSIAEQGQGINNISSRLDTVESNINNLNTKMDSIISLLGGNLLASKSGRTASMSSCDASTIHDEDKQNRTIFQNKSASATTLQTVESPKGLEGNLSHGSDNYLDKYISDAPLNIIKQIDSSLFKRVNKYDPLEKACEEFLQFYFKNEALCLQLAKSFLETSHFWIIPGGLKELNRAYVTEHPLITCVFVILAMCFDENYNYIEEQQQLYWLTTKLLGIALITDPLTDHDIEALLYLSLYNIARKPKQPQTDSWLLSGSGIQHFLTAMDFTAIKNRVLYLREFSSDDLFHLRVWNSLCACHFQASILSGRPVLIARQYFDIHTLTLKFPRATIGDAIKVSELNLDVIFLNILENSKEYFNTYIFPDEYDETFVLKFKELDNWKSKWDHLIRKDVSGILMFAYDTYHVIICRRLVAAIQESQTDKETELISYAYKTACNHSFMILERLLKLPASLIRGSPSSSLLQIVYASLTLCDHLQIMNLEEKSMALSLISKIYWHLNYIGEKMNDATDTVGKIIKSIVETASRSADTAAEREEMTVSDGSKNPNDTVYDPAKAATEERWRSFNVSPDNHASQGGASTKASSPAESKASASSYTKMTNLYSGNLTSLHLNQLSPHNSISSPDNMMKKEALLRENQTVAQQQAAAKTSPFDFDSVQIPDVSQFNTFEDFFNGVFSDFNGDFSSVSGARLDTPKLTGIGGTSGISRLGKVNNGKDTI